MIGDIAVPLAASWLLVTVLFQFRPFSQKYQTLDRIGALPRWRFFTQDVGSYRLAVEVRYRDGQGDVTPWERAQLWPRHRWRHTIFYPEQALGGILWIAADRLARRALRGDAHAALAGSQAYATLLNHLRRARPESALQFAVWRSEQGNGEPGRLFISEFSEP